MNSNIGFLFDLDGVLVDSETEYTRIWNEINDIFPTGVENFAHVIKGTTLPNILSTYFSKHDIKEITRLLYQKEEEMRYDYCSGARDLIIELKKRHIPMAIVTSSNKDKMRHLWRDMPELQELIDVVVDADMVTNSKPDPEGYLLGAKLLGINPRNCVVVEDSIQGMRAGKSADSLVIGVATTFDSNKIGNEPDILLNSLTEIELDKVINILKTR
jgi:HAD superfamily hydrolase (TIGR01509 family)